MKRFLFLLFVAMSCSSVEQTRQEAKLEDIPSTKYQELHRPQFHFSPKEKWMNDPNGMVYYEGEYHLFYQYYPDSTVWGPMHWGHAVSSDLVSWQHLPIGIYPDSLGYIFSGSAVVDWNNTSGFGSDGQPPLVAIFTQHDPVVFESGGKEYQYQSIAFSLDKGRTWELYGGNPVLPNQGIEDFRDPKVMWHEDTKSWVMTLAVKDHIEFYSSPNLKEWSKLSDFGIDRGAHGGVWECPDLFKLTTDSGESRWILLVSINPGGPNGGSATQYFVGEFDGETFTSDQTESRWLDYGTDNYAGVTWSDIPNEDGRRLFIGWMSNWNYAQVVPTDKWRSAMTVTRELKLSSDEDGKFNLISCPVNEYGKLASSTKNLDILATGEPSEIYSGEQLIDMDIEISFENSSSLEVTFFNQSGDSLNVRYNLNKRELSIDRSKSGKVDFEEGFGTSHVAPLTIADNALSLRILVDWSSIEVFAQNGEVVMTDVFFPSSPLSTASIVADGESKVTGSYSVLQSIWESNSSR